jgi:uncharacterized membrane protein
MSQQPEPPQQPPQTPQTTGLQENVAGMLCYAGWWVTGILFLVLEPNNKNIKFHAWQSILSFGAFFIVALILSVIPGIWFIGLILWIAGVILWIYLMYSTYQGRKIVLPVVGQIAQRWAEQPPGTSPPPAPKQ